MLPTGTLLYVFMSCGTFLFAINHGKTSIDRKQNGNQMFSHDHFLTAFIGRAKEPFIAPARIAMTIPKVKSILYSSFTIKISLLFFAWH
jgi:hypothetical protein